MIRVKILTFLGAAGLSLIGLGAQPASAGVHINLGFGGYGYSCGYYGCDDPGYYIVPTYPRYGYYDDYDPYYAYPRYRHHRRHSHYYYYTDEDSYYARPRHHRHVHYNDW